MKTGADPEAEDRATAIMWIFAGLFVIPFMIGSGFGASWVAGMTYGYVVAIVPAAIVVIGIILGILAIARRARSARFPRTGLVIALGVCIVLIVVASMISSS
ncbi:hypothetical protein [Microbacterium sp. RU33B]|uniref:hypothetical protein n=1 Tax=Microbacterium sp. RU33B TaxID=1907390 RepID=UPI000959DCB8|nr:hypothetical protein [Microbacterium sp. RU33B]SIT74531.1 hypothetical protein SAMN05880545_1358 [Microbacterium sp. RU33B]